MTALNYWVWYKFATTPHWRCVPVPRSSISKAEERANELIVSPGIVRTKITTSAASDFRPTPPPD